MAALLRRYFMAGLLIWVPLLITVAVLDMLIGFMDRTLLLLPPQWRPEALLGYPIPGLGLVLTLVIVLLTGLLAANFLGRRVVALWEALLARIPLVRSIYSAVKQVAETLFAANGEAFRKVLLIEYPRRGIWTLAFQTGTASGEIHRRTEAEVITVFVPTTPNPTSGFIMMIPRNEVMELEMSVEDALKLVVSLGVVTPREVAAKAVAPES
ncbi:hypothetical protein BJI67_13105 [Acidihalobacter aeolianus]|uniref:DUF502 domain-containing protein n=1 Tax=Acidihalobacter aeolianus TaxID=2792603 RepID=A0A1D8KA67_9GAMM|nr:DUF502 domain-containing protein [Acidihalobacter aeolianus]AOV17868.1 hypothetical protein BJI67_13105 [Acidihalobacter aeolianus]